MIVRTTPDIHVDPDMLRAMQRLESQLRRAADDLALTLGEFQRPIVQVVPEPIPEPVRRHGRVACGRWMPVRREPCARKAFHRGCCRSRQAMDDETIRRYPRWR